MQIAQVLAGYSLADADLLRRAMGKKKPEEMAKQRAVFLQGAMKNDVPESQAGHIFDLMDRFGKPRILRAYSQRRFKNKKRVEERKTGQKSFGFKKGGMKK